jgi:hypothetical protein
MARPTGAQAASGRLASETRTLIVGTSKPPPSSSKTPRSSASLTTKSIGSNRASSHCANASPKRCRASAGMSIVA